MSSTDHDDYDPDRFGDRGQPAGLPCLDTTPAQDAAFASRPASPLPPSLFRPIPTVRKVTTQPVRVDPDLLAEARRIREEREAREALADRAEMTDAERDHWSAQMAEEATCEGRIHRKAPVNPHGD